VIRSLKTLNDSDKTTLTGLIRLTRWQDHLPFVLPLTLLGVLLATQSRGIRLDWRLLVVTGANILAVTYAFMLNDIEDAPDDAVDPNRAARNAIASGDVTPRAGYIFGGIVALLALILYVCAGIYPLILGSVTLLLAHFYSWRRLRLKAWPVVDVISHALMLSGLLFLAGYFVYHQNLGAAWFVAGGVTLFSAYGQLYNQLRDYAADQQAGLHNTAILLGRVNTRRCMIVALGLAIGCLVIAVVRAVFPLELGAVLLGSIAVSAFFKPQTDARGSTPADASGSMQIPALIAINSTALAWLVYAIGEQWQILANLGG